MAGRTFVLDRRTEGKLAAGYAKGLVELKHWTEIPQEFVHKSLPKGALENAEKLYRFSHYHQLFEASKEADAAFRYIAAGVKSEVSGYVNEATDLIGEMFQNYEHLGIKDEGNLAKLKSRFETLKGETKRAAFDYDNGLNTDMEKINREKLSKVTTDIIISEEPEMVDSLWDVVFCMKRMASCYAPELESNSLRELYDSFVEHAISALIDEAARGFSE